MLAMGFVSVLLIAVAMTVIQIASVYNRGITLKDVNQVGRSLASELQRSIAQTASFSVDLNKPGSRYVNKSWGGRLCLGQYSYIWNYGKAIQTGDTSRNVYLNSGVEIRFVKALDSNANYCTNTVAKIDSTNAVELLDADVQNQHDLAIHSFTISSTPSTADTAFDAKTGQRLYSIKFLLGTNDQTALTFDSGGAVICKPPNESGADPAYCSVNQFDVVARAGNTVEK
jgi:hypothetical protein